MAETRANAFASLGRRLNSARTAQEASGIIADVADQLLGWDSCVVQVVRREAAPALETVFWADTVDGLRKDCLHDSTTPPVSGALTLRTVERGPQLVTRKPGDPGDDTVLLGTPKRSASVMLAPVQAGRDVVAVLSVHSYRENAYSQQDLAVLLALADHCGGALERIRAEGELLRLKEELERRVAERTSQLEAINKELEAFSYSVSHDLRAPLRSIRGFTDVLMERYVDQLDQTGQEFLRRVCDSSKHMDRLIEDLLKLSRVGRAELRLQEVDLTATATAIAYELQQTAPLRQVTWAIAPGLRAHGDARLLKIALENLLRNAWKFTGKNPAARIEFGVSETGERSFYVRDDGAGFDMAYAPKLFGVFQRLHSASEFPGTGVGLATVQRIINRHGGRVWADAAPNKGATFFFTLPSSGTAE